MPTEGSQGACSREIRDLIDRTGSTDIGADQTGSTVSLGDDRDIMPIDPQPLDQNALDKI